MSLPLSILANPSSGDIRDSSRLEANSPFPSQYSLERPESTYSANDIVPDLVPPEKRLPERILREPPSQQALHHAYSTYSKNAPSTHTANTNLPDFEVDWEDEKDKQNPQNWAVGKKALVIAAISWGTFCTVVYSTSYTTGTVEMGREFHVSSEPVITLGLTTYCKRIFERTSHGSNANARQVFGLAIGSMVLAPISEMYGRRPVYIVGMGITTVLIIPCGIGNSLQELIIVRFFGAFFGAVMIAISPGTISDIASAEYRALAFSIWAVGPLNGPTFGPVIGGFATQCVPILVTGLGAMLMGLQVSELEMVQLDYDDTYGNRIWVHVLGSRKLCTCITATESCSSPQGRKRRSVLVFLR